MVMLYLDQMPQLIAEERLQRFEDMLMTNENVKDTHRKSYINRLNRYLEGTRNEGSPKKEPPSKEQLKAQMAAFGIKVEGIDG